MTRLAQRSGWLAILSLLALLVLPAGLRAQEEPGKGEMDPEMMTRREAMMAQHEQMVARMDSLAAAMNGSTGEARTDAMAALLNELVAQHRMMHEHMRAMMQGMHGMHDMMGGPHGAHEAGENPPPGAKAYEHPEPLPD